MRVTRLWRGGLLTVVPVLSLLLNPAPAQAARIPIFIIWGSGETISHLGELLPEVKQSLPPQIPRHVKVGFAYNYFHLFWCNVWTWNGRYVLYDGNRYMPLQEGELVALTGKAEGDYGKPFFYQIPIGLVILVGLVTAGCVGAVMSRRKGPTEFPAGDPMAGLIPDQPQRPFHAIFAQMYQPDEVLRQRMPSVEEFGNYVKALDGELAAFAAERPFDGQALSLFVAVRPGRRSRVWLEFRPGGVPAHPERDLVSRLEAVPAPEVNGPVAMATYSLLWGGPGTKENLFAFMPAEWAEAVSPGAVLPDDALRKVWPD
jgi:hypothetical protein